VKPWRTWAEILATPSRMTFWMDVLVPGLSMERKSIGCGKRLWNTGWRGIRVKVLAGSKSFKKGCWLMGRLSPGFYWVRVGDESGRVPWTIREYDGGVWWSLGVEGSEERMAVTETSSDLVGPLDEPNEPGAHIDMWAERPLGFYWMWRSLNVHQDGYWEIAEFDGNGWTVMDSDMLWNDGDMIDYPIRGPIHMPGPAP
jgi:hypothetical protein